MSSFWKKAVSLLVMAALLFWSLRGVDLREVAKLFGNMRWELLNIVVGLTMGDISLRALAWKVTVDRMKRVRYTHILSAFLIGQLANIALPLKFGDVAQGYLLGKREEIRMIATYSSIVIVRLFQFVSLAAILAVVLPMVSRNDAMVRGGWALFGFIAVILPVVFLFYRYGEPAVYALLKRMRRRSPHMAGKARDLVVAAKTGMKGLSRTSTVLALLSVTFFSWLVEIVMIRLTAEALGIPIGMIASAVVLLAINLGIIVSPTPGNLGTFQFVSILSLSWFDVSKAKAFSFSVMMQVIQGFPVIVGGLMSVWYELFRNGKMRHSRGKKKEYQV